MVALANLEDTVVKEDARLSNEKKGFVKKAWDWTKRNSRGIAAGILFGTTVLTGPSCVNSTPPNPINITIEDKIAKEGQECKIDFYASGNIEQISGSISGYKNVEITGDEPNFTLSGSQINPNDNGLEKITVEATDVNGNYAKETADLFVEDTPDLVMEGLPQERIQMSKDSTSIITANIHDDYTPYDQIYMEGDFDLGQFNIIEPPNEEGYFSFSLYATKDGTGTVKLRAYDTENMSREWVQEVNVSGEGNNPPIVNAPSDIYTQEGTGTSFPFEVEDETKKEDLTYQIISDYYNAEFEMGEGNEVVAKVSIKEGEDKNKCGEEGLELLVSDNEKTTTKYITAHIENTPDCETDLPSAADVPYQSTKEIEFILEDDYTPEGELKLGVSTSDPNLEAHIEEISPNERKLVINAANVEEGKYNTKVWVEDDEDNHEEYNIETNVLGPGNNPPIVNAPSDIYTQEGTGTSFTMQVEDETKKEDLTYRIISDYYDAEFEMLDGKDVGVNLSLKTGVNPNENGTKTLEARVSDNENTTTKYITAHIENTPDCVFVDLPESMNTEYQGTAEATFKAEDDYNLEDLIASGSCSNPDVNVQVNKLDTGLYKIIADTSNLDNQEEATYDITVVLEDPVENISNDATVLLNVGAPPASYMTVNLSFEGIDVHDDDDDGVIDRYTTGNDTGEVAISAYKVPVTSYSETGDAIYFNVDRNNKEKVMDWTNYDASEGASFQLPQGNWQDYLLEIEVKDTDGSHQNLSFLVDPSKDSVTKHLKTGEDDKVLNILLGYGVGNHPDSAQQRTKYWEMPYTTTDWANGGPNEIWFIITPDDEAVLTDTMHDAIYRSLGNWFPGVDVIEKSSYSSVPNNTVLVTNNNTGGGFVWNYDDSQYIAKGEIKVPYDIEGQWTAERRCEEETFTVSEGSAESQGLGENTVAEGLVTEKTPADEAVFEIKYNKNPVVAWSVAYRGDPWNADDASDDLYYRANALYIDGKTGYVKPIRRDF